MDEGEEDSSSEDDDEEGGVFVMRDNEDDMEETNRSMLEETNRSNLSNTNRSNTNPTNNNRSVGSRDPFPRAENAPFLNNPDPDRMQKLMGTTREDDDGDEGNGNDTSPHTPAGVPPPPNIVGKNTGPVE